MRRFAALALVLAAACTHGGGASEDWAPAKDAKSGIALVPKGEEALLLAVLRAYYGEGKGFVLRQETIPFTKRKSLAMPQDHEAIKRFLPLLPKAAADAFAKLNRQAALVKGPAPAGVELAAGKKLQQMFAGDEDGWERFKKAYPKAHALVSVARPGTTAEHDEALVYFTETAGDAEGKGVMVHAKASGDRWKIAKKAVVWGQ